MGQPETNAQYSDPSSTGSKDPHDAATENSSTSYDAPGGMKENISQAGKQTGSGEQGQGFGGSGPGGKTEGGDPVADRQAAGYGGSKDMNREIGA